MLSGCRGLTAVLLPCFRSMWRWGRVDSRKRGRHIAGGGKKGSSTSSNMGPLDVPRVRTGQRRGAGDEKVEALWQRAFDPGTLVPLDQYATSSTFEDPGDKRTTETKYNWWGVYVAQRRARGLYVPDVFDERSDRYLATMTRSATRRKQKDRRKEARAAAKGPVVDLVSECSGREDDDGAGGSVASGGGSKRKRRESRSEDARSKPRGTKARKVDVHTDSDDVPRYLHPDRVDALLRIMPRVTIWWPTKSRRIPCALSVQCGGRRAGFSA